MTDTNVPPVCTRCSKYIYDGTIVQVKDEQFHTNCVQCVVCRDTITGTCHLKDNEFYCRTDFIRLHGAKCVACHEIISPSEGVHDINGGLYHSACFSCSTCARQLCTGDFVYLKDDGKLLCSHDYQMSTATAENSQAETDSESDESGSDDTDVRHRMTVNDTQLRMLSEAYSDNNRPSKRIRKQLSKDSNLSDRTIQMWFHNRRAKDKSIIKKSCFSDQKQRFTVEHRPANPSTEQQWSDNKVGPQRSHSRYTRENTSFRNETAILNQDTLSTNFQLFCPLDYLVPNEMPPNVDLSSADICNGEVIPGKHNTANYHMRQTIPECLSQWLSV